MFPWWNRRVLAADATRPVLAALFLAAIIMGLMYAWVRGKRETEADRRASSEAYNEQKHMDRSRAGFTYEEEQEWREFSLESAIYTRQDGRTPAEVRQVGEYNTTTPDGLTPGLIVSSLNKRKRTGSVSRLRMPVRGVMRAIRQVRLLNCGRNTRCLHLDRTRSSALLKTETPTPHPGRWRQTVARSWADSRTGATRPTVRRQKPNLGATPLPLPNHIHRNG
jgi:hypothetical protein